MLTVPAVVSIDRADPLPPNTGATSVTYTVTFSEAVTGVASTDFAVASTGTASVGLPVAVTGNGAVYAVTVDGIQGAGDVRLDLVDDDTIQNLTNDPLGGVGLGNGNFQGQAYTIDQVAPFVQSIVGTTPANLTTGASTVVYTVTFSEPVSNVDPTDFTLALTGTVTANAVVGVVGGPSVYSVTVSGIGGIGSLRLNLADNGSIRDAAGNRLVTINSPATFAAQTTHATGLVPTYVITADVNEDQNPDLIVANFLQNNVSVLLGNGDGSFQAQVPFATGASPNALAAADLNGDGLFDLAVANLGSDTVGVLLGNGDGSFQAQTAFATGVDPQSVAVADVNRDGRPDLLVANVSGNTAGVLLGNGDGTFQSEITFATGLKPQSIVAADVNADNLYDLVIANFGNNNVGVLLGNGDGTFQAQATFATGWKPQAISVADVNGDLAPDVIVANSGDNNVGVLLGNGDGTFQSQVTFSAGTNPQSVAVAEVNGDGKRDLIVANFGADSLGVLLGNGNGVFQNQVTLAAGDGPQWVTSADVNHDSKADLISANFLGSNASVLLGNSTGSFAGQIYTIESATHLEFVTPPGTNAAGSPLNGPTGVQVVVKDRFDNVVVDDTSTVTLTLVGGTFAGGGTTALAPVSGGTATFANLVINAPGVYSLTASDGLLVGATTPNFTVTGAVAGRKLFYNGSPRYDVTNATFPGFSDDNAIATDKVALLSGTGPATFANVSSFSQGITGVMVDLFGSGSYGASDFTFRVGNNNTPASWATAPAPATVTVRTGAGSSGSDRVELIWAPGAIQKTWLEVIVAANAQTALASPDVFFFGNALGDSGLGDTVTLATVNASDELGARNNPQSLLNNIPITNLYDYNRDGAVNASDELIARNNGTGVSTATKYLDIASVPPPAVVADRKLFYDGSSRYDVTNGTFPGFSDDNAIATDKVALLPGAGPATFANVSSFSLGITGVMIDLLGSGSHSSITASDFILRVGNNNTPSSWATAPAPATVTVRTGAGVSGSDRVELIWAADAITKTWLQVITLSNSHTGLLQGASLPYGQADVFFFGSAVGDSGLGDTATLASVNATDELGARNNPQSLLNNIPITNLYDYNRDGTVNATDQLIARNNPTGVMNATIFIQIGLPPAAPEGASPQTATSTDDDATSPLIATDETTSGLETAGTGPIWQSPRREIGPNVAPSSFETASHLIASAVPSPQGVVGPSSRLLPCQEVGLAPLEADARPVEHSVAMLPPAALHADRALDELDIDEELLDALLSSLAQV